MDVYSLTKKEMNKFEKEFSKTVMGRKVRIPVFLSILLTVVTAAVTLGTKAMLCMGICKPVSCATALNCGYGFCDPMLYLIAFLLVILMILITLNNYNRELKNYIKAQNYEEEKSE